jgi:hypothetical protein
MSFLSKVENGYLQFLRLVFLIIATLALVVAFGLGISAWLDYSAKPTKPSNDISIDAAAFRLNDKESATQPETKPVENAEDQQAAKLTNEFVGILTKHGKQLVSSSYKADKDGIRSFIDARLQNEFSVEFLEKQIKYIDDVLSRPDIVKNIKGAKDEFIDVVNESIAQFTKSYQREQERIVAEETAAKEQVVEKRASAIASLAVIGGATGLFVVLVLLLVLFRVDRSIRQLATAHMSN